MRNGASIGGGLGPHPARLVDQPVHEVSTRVGSHVNLSGQARRHRPNSRAGRDGTDSSSADRADRYCPMSEWPTRLRPDDSAQEGDRHVDG